MLLERERNAFKFYTDKFIREIECFWKKEPLDGDETEEMVKIFEKRLNEANGNQ